VSTHGEVPARALTTHKASEFIEGARPDYKLEFNEFKLEDFVFRPGSLNAYFKAQFKLVRPNGSEVPAHLNRPIELRLTLQTRPPPKEMSGTLSYRPQDQFTRSGEQGILLAGPFSMTVLPKTPEHLLYKIGMGFGLFLLPRTAEQLLESLPAGITSRRIKEAKYNLAKTSKMPLVRRTFDTYSRTMDADRSQLSSSRLWPQPNHSGPGDW
jgi:hypothetical protein